MTRFLKRLLIPAIALLALPAMAQQNAYGDGVTEARILTGWQRADGRHVAALQITLGEGWKTYWRAPGDAGIPPQFDWRRSRNISAVTPSWPTPQRFRQSGLTSLGYQDVLVLPLTLTPKRKGSALKLAGEVTLGVCKEICVPVTLNLSQELPASAGKRDPRIVAALANRPYTAAEAGVGRVACRISPMTDGVQLRAEIDLPRTGGRELAVVETANPMIWVAQAKTTRKGNRLIAETQLYHVDGRSFALDRSGLRITVLGKSHAVDIQGCPAG